MNSTTMPTNADLRDFHSKLEELNLRAKQRRQERVPDAHIARRAPEIPRRGAAH